MAAPDKLSDYTVSKGPEGLATSGIKVYQPYGDHRQVPVNAEYRYRCLRPTTAYFSKAVRIADPAQAHRGSDKDTFCTFLTAQPIDTTLAERALQDLIPQTEHEIPPPLILEETARSGASTIQPSIARPWRGLSTAPSEDGLRT